MLLYKERQKFSFSRTVFFSQCHLTSSFRSLKMFFSVLVYLSISLISQILFEKTKRYNINVMLFGLALCFGEKRFVQAFWLESARLERGMMRPRAAPTLPEENGCARNGLPLQLIFSSLADIGSRFLRQFGAALATLVWNSHSQLRWCQLRERGNGNGDLYRNRSDRIFTSRF